jgi:tRNA pseudouridine55 synthase
MDGLINVLKPPGMTSHDVILHLRKIFGIQRIGHAGTLDPGAAGVLPVCVGQGTKVAEFLMDHRKRYRGEMVLGIRTDTYDAGGKVLQKQAPINVDLRQLEKVFRGFVGEIRQIPPMVSALHYQGKRLYQLAREGKSVKREARRVTVYSLDILKVEEDLVHPRILFEIFCSKGTYVRSICAEIGEKLGCGAYLSFLVRTASGPFEIKDALTLEEIEGLWVKGDRSFILPVDYGLEEIPALTVKERAVKNVINGTPLAPSGIKGVLGNNNPPQLVRLYSPEGVLLAIGEYKVLGGGRWFYKPKKVFHFWKKYASQWGNQ